VKDKDGQLRVYTFAQLEDLQSRLMLVSRKSERSSQDVQRNAEVDVDRFSMVCIKIILRIIHICAIYRLELF